MPGGTNCCVACCKNSYYKTKHLTGESRIGYLKFPEDPSLLNLWVNACRRRDSFNPKGGRVCTAHFSADDFIRDLKSELGIGKHRFNLKPGVVPSLNLGVVLPQRSPSSRKKRHDEKLKELKRKELVKELLERDRTEEATVSSIDVENEEAVDYRILYEELKEEHTLLQQKFEELRSSKEELENNLTKIIESRVREAMSSCMSPSQIDILLKKKKQVRGWKERDMEVALTIRYFSKKCYNYLREKLNYPLPGVSTLERWATKFNKQIDENVKTNILISEIEADELSGDEMEDNHQEVEYHYVVEDIDPARENSIEMENFNEEESECETDNYLIIESPT